ncbi:hypothetical protein PG993_007307 [Apiospora rasikravindrae]|uniref:Uncharacterized protein n=1 Tax=Apiospora rasikravindrae TaxID=990691 RepID=A0ABR1SX44_9PEZI
MLGGFTSACRTKNPALMEFDSKIVAIVEKSSYYWRVERGLVAVRFVTLVTGVESRLSKGGLVQRS